MSGFSDTMHYCNEFRTRPATSLKMMGTAFSGIRRVVFNASPAEISPPVKESGAASCCRMNSETNARYFSHEDWNFAFPKVKRRLLT